MSEPINALQQMQINALKLSMIQQAADNGNMKTTETVRLSDKIFEDAGMKIEDSMLNTAE